MSVYIFTGSKTIFAKKKSDFFIPKNFRIFFLSKSVLGYYKTKKKVAWTTKPFMCVSPFLYPSICIMLLNPLWSLSLGPRIFQNKTIMMSLWVQKGLYNFIRFQHKSCNSKSAISYFKTLLAEYITNLH